MIECRKYTLTEFKSILKISKRQWEDRKEELLEHLSIYFDYEITRVGRGWSIDIKEQYGEYEPLGRKHNIKEIKEYYYEKTKEEVKEKPWNTGSNISRNIIAKDQNIFNHTEGTMSNYIRPIVRDKFVSPINESQWMKLSEDKLSYEPLTQEEHDYFISLFSSEEDRKERAKIIGDYKSRYITKAEMKEKLFEQAEFRYDQIISSFKKKFNFVPISVKYLQETQDFTEAE